jgi:hypothetical protein
MQTGMIGLGRMGAYILRRLLQTDHDGLQARRSVANSRLLIMPLAGSHTAATTHTAALVHHPPSLTHTTRTGRRLIGQGHALGFGTFLHGLMIFLANLFLFFNSFCSGHF